MYHDRAAPCSPHRMLHPARPKPAHCLSSSRRHHSQVGIEPKQARVTIPQCTWTCPGSSQRHVSLQPWSSSAGPAARHRATPHTTEAPTTPQTAAPSPAIAHSPVMSSRPTHHTPPPIQPAPRPHSRQDSTSDPTPISTHQTPTGSPAPIALPLPPYISHRRAPPSLHSPALGSTSTEMTSTSQPRTKMPTTSTRITTPTHTKPAASAQHHEPHALHEQPEPSPITPAARDVTEHQDHHAEPLHQPARSRRARTQPRPIPIQQPAPIPRSPKTSTLSPTNHRTARRAPHTTASSGAGRAR